MKRATVAKAGEISRQHVDARCHLIRCDGAEIGLAEASSPLVANRLLETLKGEGPGILNWALAGLREWRKSGLQIPRQITAATAAYRDEQDILGDWIAENCNTGVGCSEIKGALYADYAEWAKQNGHKPLAQGRLTRRLNERGYRLAADKRTVHGLALTSGRALRLGRIV